MSDNGPSVGTLHMGSINTTAEVFGGSQKKENKKEKKEETVHHACLAR